jgi:Asp-tRNA(Asn)/Glu-tRNA(Gln) amidotransferase B subunit
MEFVFEPDLVDGEEAAALVKELIFILQLLGACSGKMEGLNYVSILIIYVILFV